MIDRKQGCHGFAIREDERAQRKRANSGGYLGTRKVEKMACSASSSELCYALGYKLSALGLLASKDRKLA